MARLPVSQHCPACNDLWAEHGASGCTRSIEVAGGARLCGCTARPPETPPPEQRSNFCPSSRGWLLLAQDIRLTAAGSFDRDDDAQEHDIALVRQHLESWRPSLFPRDERWDAAVRELLLAALHCAGQPLEGGPHA